MCSHSIVPAQSVTAAVNAATHQRLREMTPPLWRFALRLTRDARMAESLVMSACREAMQSVADGCPDVELRCRLHAILHASWWNELRPFQRNRRQRALAVREDAGQRGAEAQQVIELVDALPDPLRSAMLLVAAEGFTVEQAASILAMPPEAVIQLIVQARLHIGQHLVRAAAAEPPATPRTARDLA